MKDKLKTVFLVHATGTDKKHIIFVVSIFYFVYILMCFTMLPNYNNFTTSLLDVYNMEH